MPAENVQLIDAATGSTAMVAPHLGFNCFSFRPIVAGKPREVLWSAPGFIDGDQPPTRSGIPILFPFAGRIRGTSYRFEGREYVLEGNDPRGNAIHGFVLRRPWRLIEQAAARVVGEFHASVDDASLLARWPADFRIRVAYEVSGPRLLCDVRIDNPDRRPLPFGLGTHGYFRVPLADGGRAEDCILKVPASTVWELEGLLPTGRYDSNEMAQALTAGLPLGDTQLDHVLGGLGFAPDRLTTEVIDPQSSAKLTLSFDRSFPTCVVFIPPHREAVCIEPYTTVPDPFTLAERGINPNLVVLALGEVFQTRIELRVQ